MKNWKTTVFGALLLALSGFQIYANPKSATDSSVMGQVAAGIGLIQASDSKKE